MGHRIWFHRIIWGLFSALAVFVVGMFPTHWKWPDHFRQVAGTWGFLFMAFGPMIYWEQFCRFTPASSHRLVSISSSLARCVFIYLPANIVFHTIMIQVGWGIRWWLSPSECIGLGIAVGGVCLAICDYCVARKLSVISKPHG